MTWLLTCGLDCWLFCIFIIESSEVKTVKGRKGTFMIPGKTIQLPSVSHGYAECVRGKKKKRGKEENHLIFKDSVIVHTDEIARLSMLRQP